MILIMAVVTVYSVVRTPSFQEFAGRMAADYVHRTYGIEMYLDKLRISDMLMLELEDLTVKDHHSNILLEAENITVRLREISISERYLWLDAVKIDKLAFFLHQYDNDTLVNMDVLLHKLSSPVSDSVPDTAAAGEPWKIYCDDLSLEGTSFGFIDDRVEHPGTSIDFTDILITDINFSAKDVTVIGDSISTEIIQLSFYEKSGLHVDEFNAKAQVSPTGIRTKDLVLKTAGTTAYMDLDFLYNGFDEMGYFLDSVYIDARIRESVLTLADIGCFAPELKVMEDPIMFSGDVRGFISDFSAKDFNFNVGNFTEFNGDVAMKGLPDIYSTLWDVNFKQFIITAEDLEQFNLPVPQGNILLPGPLHELGMTSLTGTFRGYYNDFTADLYLISDIGSVSFAGTMKEDDMSKEPVYAGEITARSLNLEAISGSSDLGLADIDIEFEGRSIDPEKMEISLNGWIENLSFKDYRYEKIIFGGIVSGKSYAGRILVSDPGLDLAFDGKVDFNGPLPAFDYTCEILTAKFYELNLSGKSIDMDLKTHIEGNFSGISMDEFTGRIGIRDLVYHENGQNYLIDSIELSRTRKPGERERIELHSDFADAVIEGPLVIKDLPDLLAGLIFEEESHPSIQDDLTDTVGQIKFDIVFKDLQPIADVFFPTVSIAPGANIHGNLDIAAHRLELKALADSVYAYGIGFDNIAVICSSRAGRLRVTTDIREVILSEDADTTVIGFPNFRIDADAGMDSINYKLTWDDYDNVQPNHAIISGFIIFPTQSRLEASFSEAHAEFNGRSWSLEGKNYLVFDSAYKQIDNLRIARDNELFIIDGRLSNYPADTLGLTFINWSLGNFNSLLESSSMSVDGVINGKLGIFMNDSIPNLFAGLKIKDFALNDVLFGDASINTHWMESDKAMAVDVDIFSNASSGDPYRILGVNGLYYPFDSERNFDFDIRTQNLNVSVMEPLLESFSSHLAGFATGQLSLKGTLDKPELTGKLKLLRAELLVDYLNVTYSFSNEIIFDKDFIHFDRVAVFDPNTNQGTIEGGIRHQYFKDFRLDLNIETDKLMALNLNRYQNEVFYGTAFATGNVKLSGPFNNIAIGVQVKTEKGTRVTIPINYSVDVSQGDFIVFKNMEDSLKVEEHRDIQVEGVSLDIVMNVTKDADIEIILPGNIGYIKANGSGNLRLGVDPNGYLTLAGSYKILSGLFLFSLEQLVSRRFEIQEGSSISWTGDINDAEVNIVARYRLRTTLSGLGSSLLSEDAASQKVNVNTDIRMTGSLFNPELSFGITFPNMQEQDKQAIYAVLDTNDQGLMNQQAISLLVLNSFSTTGTGGSNPVNPASIMSNTLSSMLSQISNDFNIGINYVPGDRVTSEQLEVALSTQLLDDRLTIDGNIDVSSDNSTSQHTSSIVGDVNIEYKLTRDGRFRVKAFNRSNDLSLLNDYAPYTQGVGIFYRKEFNNITELFSRRERHKIEKDP